MNKFWWFFCAGWCACDAVKCAMKRDWIGFVFFGIAAICVFVVTAVTA